MPNQDTITRRSYLYHAARSEIGTMPHIDNPEHTMLRRDEIPAWLHKHGCPVLFERGLNLLDVKNQTVRSLIDLAAQHGLFNGYDGLVIPTHDQFERTSAFRLAAVASSEFLRRKRTVAWRTADEIVTGAPRRVEDSDEDIAINDAFLDLIQVYELLVITGVPLAGYTPHELRAVVRVLSARQTEMLPTIVTVIPGAGAQEDESTVLETFLLSYYGVNEL